MRFPVLLALSGSSPAHRWRLVSSLFEATRAHLEGSAGLIALQLICLARTGSKTFAVLAVLVIVMTTLRLIDLARFRRDCDAAIQARRHAPEYWATHYLLGAAAHAGLWGATDIYLLLGFDDQVMQMLFLCIQGGWAGTASVHASNSPATVLALLSLTMGPLILSGSVGGGILVRALVPFAVAYFLANLRIARELGARTASLMDSEFRLEEANARLLLISATDGLTGIANRRAFDAALAADWAQATRSGEPIALLMIDVDFFKKYNDHYGHLGGDECLRRIAACCSTVSRRANDRPARYGGEEFAILLPNTPPGGAYEVAACLHDEVHKAAISHAACPLGRLTLSIGIGCMAPAPGDTPNMLIQQADSALYKAKQTGRDRSCIGIAEPLEDLGEERKPSSSEIRKIQVS